MTTSTAAPRHLDGNAVAGTLMHLFGTDITAAKGTCSLCGRRAAIAQTRVYVDAPGVVVRCAGCENLLMRWVATPITTYLEMPGLRSLEIAVQP